MKFLIFLFLITGVTLGYKVSYEGYKMYKITTNSKEQRDILLNLPKNNEEYDVWYNNGQNINVMVAPNNFNYFDQLIAKNNMKYEILIHDVQQKISIQKVANKIDGNMTWTEYHKLENIYLWLDKLSERYPNIVEQFYYGMSYEGRDLRGVKISFGKGKKKVMIDGGTHAREWITHATATYIINELLVNKDPRFRKIAESFDWYIVPVVNPDGYAYSHTDDRLWRKTRAKYGDCYGVDPNRNWDFHWGEHNASLNCSSNNYVGPFVFSEKEPSSLAALLKTIANKLTVYLTLHSYRQLFLIPYSNTSEHLENYDDVLQIGQNAVKEITKKYGTVYRVGNNDDLLYLNSGTSKDWSKEKLKIPIVYTVELRDTGEHGHVLPEDQILPNCEEFIDGLIGLFEEAERLGYVNLK